MRTILHGRRFRGKVAPAEYVGAIGFFCILLLSFVYPAPLNAKTLRISLPPKGEVSQRVKTVKQGLVAVKVVGTVDLTQFHAWLNGSEVTTAFDTVQRRRKWRRKARLGASYGLIQGSNLLEVEVMSEAGESIKDSRTFEVLGDRPLVGAGPDRIVRLGDSIRLDGSDSVSSTPLRYRWKLARAPKSSQAQLLDGDTPTPLLVPDMPGTYEIRLKVSDGKHRSGWDTVILHATAQPLTVKLNTITTDSARRPGIQVGDEFYPNAGATEGLDIQALILNRRTLQKTDDQCPRSTERGNCSISTTAELNKLEKIIDGLDRWQSLVILTRARDVRAMDRIERETFNHIVEKLGGESFPTEEFNRNPWDKAISVLGVPGFSAGQGGYQALRRDFAGIEGVLMLNAYAQYWAFSWADYRPFTVNVGKPGEITANGNTWPAGWDGRGGGFHLVMLDPVDLGQLTDFTYLTNGPEGEDFQHAMCNALKRGIGNGYVVFLASVGDPFGGDNNNFDDLNCIVQAIQGLGGTAEAVTPLKPGNGYALAARGVRPNTDAAFEASDVITLPPATHSMKSQLTGSLGLNPQGWFEPVAGGATPGQAFQLFDIAFQRPTPWPVSSTAGEQGALCSITKQYGITGTDDIRTVYTYTESFQPDLAKLNRLRFPSSNPTCGTHHFTEDDFNRVKNQLAIEFGDITTVRNFFTKVLQAPFNKDRGIQNYIDIGDIANQVKNATKAGDGFEVFMSILDIVKGALSLISAIAPLVGDEDDPAGPLDGDSPAGKGTGAATGAIGSTFTIVQGIAQLIHTGVPADSVKVRAEEAILKQQLGASIGANLGSFERIQELISSDWGKLHTVSAKANDTEEWLFSPNDVQGAVDVYNLGATTHIWSVFMGGFYQRFEVPPESLYEPITHDARFDDPKDGNPVRWAWQLQCCTGAIFTPFAESHDIGTQWLAGGFAKGPTNKVVPVSHLNTWAIMPPGNPSDRWCSDTVKVPDLDLLTDLNKAGLYMPWFWNEIDWFVLNSFYPHPAPRPDCQANRPDFWQ